MRWRAGLEVSDLPYFDDEGEVDCGHDWDDYCRECQGCRECQNCYCDGPEEDDER